MTMNVNGGPGFWRDQVVGSGANPPVTIGSNQAIVTNAQGVTMGNSSGVDSHQGIAVVGNGALSRVNLVADTSTLVDQDDSVPVLGAGGAPTGGNCTLNVSVGLLGSVQLPASIAPVSSGNNVTVGNSAGADLHNATAVVAAGAITSVNLGPVTAMTDDTDTVAVRNSAGAQSHNATAVVAAGVMTGVNLAPTTAMVDNAEAVTVRNSAGANGIGACSAVVAAGVLTGVNLPPTAAAMANGIGLAVPVTGTYVTTITPTIASGVITGFVLS